MKELKIFHLYPDLLNLYGDKGNIAVLKKRCELRDIKADIINVAADDQLSLTDADIILLGGGNSRNERIVGEQLLKMKAEFEAYRDDMGCMLALCDGFPLIGHYYSVGEEKFEGLSLCDLYTVDKEERLTGNIAIQTQEGVVVGFENHSGCTYIGDNATPFGTVIRGYGNNGEDKNEGVRFKNIIGTYLHGPLLPKNPEIADFMIEKAIERKYGEKIVLTPLDDRISEYAKSYVLDITKGK